MNDIVRATRVLRSGTWAAASAADRITLDYDQRHRRRHRFTSDKGLDFLLDLTSAVVLEAGDALELADGRLIEVDAAPEQLLRVTAASRALLVRLAWHIGNRHLPAQLGADEIVIREDSVIESMLLGLGARVEKISASFTPESGAYHQHASILRGQSNHHA